MKQDKQLNIRITTELYEEIEAERKNFTVLTCVELEQSEFIRTLIRLGLKELDKKCMQDMVDNSGQ